MIGSGARREQDGPGRWPLSPRPVRAQELDLWGDEQHARCQSQGLLAPWGRGSVRPKRDAMAVLEEALHPRPDPVSAPEGRVHPHEAIPVLGQAVHAEPAKTGDVRWPIRMRDVQVKGLSKSLEDVGRSQPIAAPPKSFPVAHPKSRDHLLRLTRIEAKWTAPASFPAIWIVGAFLASLSAGGWLATGGA